MTTRRTARGAALLLAAVALAADAAQVYKWQDDKGAWHFSDHAPAGAAAQKKELRVTAPPPPAADPAEAAPATAATTAPRPPAAPAAAKKRVVIYTTAWCPYCKKARAYLQRKGVAFTEYDVETSAEGKAKYQQLGRGGVPIIFVGERRVNGFDEGTLERLLE